MSNNDRNNIDWNKIIKKEAIGVNGEDLGEILEVGKTHIITQKGIINKKRYYLPKSSVSSFNGTILKINMTNNDLKEYTGIDGQKINDHSTDKTNIANEIETKIPVMAQDLQVSKRITENKVKIIKEPVKEIKKIEIELTHEEITIERIPANKDSISDSKDHPPQSKTEIVILLKREEPVIKRQSYVKEEVIIRKKPITETKTITDVVINERVNYADNQNEK